MDAVSKESLRQAFDEYLRGPSEVNITKPPHSVYPHYVHDDAQMEARLETFDGFRINYAEPCEIAGGTIVSNLVRVRVRVKVRRLRLRVRLRVRARARARVRVRVSLVGHLLQGVGQQ